MSKTSQGAKRVKKESTVAAKSLDKLAVRPDTIVSPHLGDVPWNEMDAFYAKPVNGAAKIFLLGDDKDGMNLFEIDSLSQPIDKNKGFRVSRLRYLSFVKDGDWWYADGTEEGWPYPGTGVSLLKARFHPRNIAYSARVFRPTKGNVKGATTFRHYWDSHLGINPVTGERYRVYQQWKTEKEGYTAARVMVAPSFEGPWREIPGDVIDSVTANRDGLSWNGYQGDPKIHFTQDNRAWLFFIYSNGYNEAGFIHGAAFCEVDPRTYKRIGPIVKLHQGRAGENKYIFCKEDETGMESNHKTNELGIHEPTYLKVENTAYILLPHASDKQNPYRHRAGFHYIKLPGDGLPPARPIPFSPDPVADYYFHFAGKDSAKAFKSLWGAEGVRGEMHDPNKFRKKPKLTKDGLVFNRDGYFQLETSLYSNQYELEIKFLVAAPEIYYLFGDWPFQSGDSRKNTVRLNYDQVQVVHEDGQSMNWIPGLALTNYGKWTTVRIINDGVTAELFVNGISQGKKSSPRSTIRISMIGGGVQGGYLVPQPNHLFAGIVEYVKLVDLKGKMTSFSGKKVSASAHQAKGSILPPPQIYSQDTASRILSFIPSTGSRELGMYEYSVDNGKTWKPLVEWQNARRGKDDLATSWNGRHEIFIGNGNYPAGMVQVRVKGKEREGPSDPAKTTISFTYSPVFHPLRPTNITLREMDESHRWGNRISWTLPFGTGSYTDFQVTTDGGKTWTDAHFIPWYTDNKPMSANQFGIRVVDRNSKKPKGPPAFYARSIPSYPVTVAAPVGFLKPLDPTVKARITAGNNSITLTNNNYQLKVGDAIIIGSERPDGLFLRTEQGTDLTWPYWSFPGLNVANDSVVAYPTAYTNGLYAYVRDSSFIIRKGSTGFEKYAPPSGSTFQYAHSRALIATVTAVNGLQVTLDKAPQISLRAATITYDNAPVLNNYFSSLRHYSVVTIQPGIYPVSRQISTGNKIGLDLRARGVTLYAPPNVPSAMLNLSNPGLKLNAYKGKGSLKVIGNYHFQGLNLNYLPKGAAYNNAFLPNLNQPIVTENFLNNHPIHIGASYSEINDIEAYNGVQYQVQTMANAVKIKGLRAGLTGMIPPVAGGVPYSELYAWGIHVSNSFNVEIDFQHDTAWTSPYWINALEAFNSSDVKFLNGIFINAMCANNGTAQVVVKNCRFIVKENSRYFQGPGFPVWEENAYFGNPYGWQKNTFDSVAIIIEGHGVAGQNTAPVGFLMRPGSSPVRYLNTTYRRSDYSGAVQGWPGQGWQVNGDGTEIRNSKAKGSFGTAYLEVYKIGQFRGSSLSVHEAGPATRIEKVQAPTFFLPANLSIANVTATEKTVTKYPVVHLGKDLQVTGPSVKLKSTILLDSRRKVVDPGTYWAVISRPAGAKAPTLSCQYGADCNEITVSGMIKGRYEFRRYVVDDAGLVGQDNVVVEVK